MAQISQVSTEEAPAKPAVATASKSSIDPLQYVWFLGHILTCVGTTIEIAAHLLFQGHQFWSLVVYRATFVIIVLTYFLSLRKKLLGQVPHFFALLPIDTFQYGLLAALWLVSKSHGLKLIPYFVYSILQSANFISTKIMPGSSLASLIDSLVAKNSYNAERVVSWSSLLLVPRLVLDVLMIRSGAFISLLAYLFFYRIRVEYSPITKNTLHDLEDIADKLFSNPKMPAKVRDIWTKTKWSIDHYGSHELSALTAKPAPPKADSKPGPPQTRPRASTKEKARRGSDQDLFLK